MVTYLKSLPDFEYVAPQNVEEICSLLQKYNGEAKLLAGGTDLLLHMKHRKIVPKYIISIKEISGLDGIAFNENNGLQLGALVNHQSIATSPMVRGDFGALSFACSRIGTPQVRHMGTVGGNLCNAAPSADAAPPLMAYGSSVKLFGSGGERVLPIESFFTGPGETVLQGDEMLCEIQIPKPAPKTGVVYIKLPARTAVDIAAVGVAASVTVEGGTCIDTKIVMGAVGPVPMRAKKAEEAIIGKGLKDSLIQEAALLASKECRPISDIRGSADYRVEMIKVLTEHALRQALGKAKSS